MRQEKEIKSIQFVQYGMKPFLFTDYDSLCRKPQRMYRNNVIIEFIKVLKYNTNVSK